MNEGTVPYRVNMMLIVQRMAVQPVLCPDAGNRIAEWLKTPSCIRSVYGFESGHSASKLHKWWRTSYLLSLGHKNCVKIM